jgi:hypothetical protein
MSTFNPVAVNVGFTANRMVLVQILQVLSFTPADLHSTYAPHSSIVNPKVYDSDLPAHYHNLHPQLGFITLTQHLPGFSYCKVLETDTWFHNCSLYSSTYWEMVWPLQMVNWKGCGIDHLRCHTTKESLHFISFGSLPLSSFYALSSSLLLLRFSPYFLLLYSSSCYPLLMHLFSSSWLTCSWFGRNRVSCSLYGRRGISFEVLIIPFSPYYSNLHAARYH